MEGLFVQQIAFYKSTNAKISLNVCSNSPKYRQTCTRGTVPPNESINGDGGGKNRGIDGGGKADGKDKSVADGRRQQST